MRKKKIFGMFFLALVVVAFSFVMAQAQATPPKPTQPITLTSTGRGRMAGRTFAYGPIGPEGISSSCHQTHEWDDQAGY